MKVKVINGFYDADLRRIVEKDETQDFADEKAKKYIAKGLAVREAEPKEENAPEPKVNPEDDENDAPEPKKKLASKKEK